MAERPDPSAPSCAKITVNSFVEGKAKKTAGKYGDRSSFHFLFDTHDRSTVGYAADRGEDLDDQRRWKRVMTQFGRKWPGDEKATHHLLRALEVACSDRGSGLESTLLASAVDLLQAQFELRIGRGEISACGGDA